MTDEVPEEANGSPQEQEEKSNLHTVYTVYDDRVFIQALFDIQTASQGKHCK